MVRSRVSRSPRTNVPNLLSSPPRSSLSHANRSPVFRSSSHGRSPKHHSSSLKRNEIRSTDDHKSRGRYRGRDQRRRGNARGADNNGRAPGNNQSGNINKGRKWGVKKKRRRYGRGRGGGNAPPVSGGNRQPIASMRMRMDDYLPRSGRLLPLQKANDIEHAMSRARREASTRTKDTFWTKKLLDAENSHPNRWAHTGFKELYREELGYSGSEYKSGDEKLGKYSREEKGANSFSSKNGKGSPSKQKSPSNAVPRSHKYSSQTPPRNLKEKGADFRNRVSVSKNKHKRSNSRNMRLSITPAADKISSLRPNRRYSRSYSRSLSSLSSSSGSDSRSRSYSSYSRSSSSSSTSSSSSATSLTTSSSISMRSYSKRPYARRHSYSNSTSRSPSPRRHHRLKSPLHLKKVSKVLITKPLLHEPKKKLPKIISSSVKPKKIIHSTSIKSKSKPVSSRTRFPIVSKVAKGNTTTITNDCNTDKEYYDPSIITEDSPPYRPTITHIEKATIHHNLDKCRLPSDSGSRLSTSEIAPRRENTDPKLRCASNSEMRNRASVSEVRTRAVEPVLRNCVSNSEVRTRSSNSGTRKKKTNPEMSRRPSEPGHKQAAETDARLAADLQRYKNSRLTRNTCQDSIILHPSGIRLKRERRSNSESSSEEEEYSLKLTLSERFGKLAQLSSQRQEYDGVRMKIVREGGQDKKVYLEGGSSRTPSPYSRRSDGAHEKWLREHKAEYDEYQQLYGEFRHWDPHRDLPNDLPPNWDDINVRYRYYKESGYFGDRAITMDDYLKWEEWWYRYKDWLEKYGGSHEADYRSGTDFYDIPRASTSSRWSRREAHREKEDRKRMRYQ